MIKAMAICGTFGPPVAPPPPKKKPAVPPHDMKHMQHGGFMQEGMHHAAAKGVTLDAKGDAAAHTVTLLVGPMNLPPHTSPTKMPQPPNLLSVVPIEGCLLPNHPTLQHST